MSSSKKKYLITSALPYANGPLHFGHLGGVYIPADIYTRHRKLQGHEVKHISGSDEHGVAITLSAEKAGASYGDWIDKWHEEHKKLFKIFSVDFDFFGRTSLPYHEDEVKEWFLDLYNKGFIEPRIEKQLYSLDDKKFLPDRYIEGICYVCDYPKARGDECPKCGEWITATKLKNPVSAISGSSNIEIRETKNHFILLKKLQKDYESWFSEKKGTWRKLVTGFIQGLIDQGLVDRCITRDLNWGIDVPLKDCEGKKIYVWFDAPIGYVSNLKEHLKSSKEDYKIDWWQNPNVEISNFIGKDNIIFHALIFPMMALGTKFINLPHQIPANEFINLENHQFSKSSGWYVDIPQALEYFDADALRFYLCAIIPEAGDTNFCWDHFEQCYKDFGNKIGNFIHRSLSFFMKNWPQGFSQTTFMSLKNHEELNRIETQIKKITQHLDKCQFTKAQAELLQFGQIANEYFHNQEPWAQIKKDKKATEDTIAVSMLYIVGIAVVMEPILPQATKKILKSFPKPREDTMEAIYNGKADRILDFFQEGLPLPASLEVLFPRLDKDQIKSFKERLPGT